MSKIESSTTKLKDKKFNGKGFMIKEGEGVAGAIRSSQDIAGKYSKICRCVKGELRGDGSKGGKHDLTMSHKRGYIWIKKWLRDRDQG